MQLGPCPGPSAPHSPPGASCTPAPGLGGPGWGGETGEGSAGPGEARARGRAACWLSLFLRTGKRKSKIDFALLDKSNKMVSGVKLILTKQNPRRLNTARRLRIKTTTTTKQLQRRLYTPKNSSPALLSYTVTQRRRTRDSHTWKRNAGAMGAALPGARAPRTLFTLWTRSCAGASPAAGAPALCPRSSCRRRGPSVARPALRPSLRPASCCPFLPRFPPCSGARPAAHAWLPRPAAWLQPSSSPGRGLRGAAGRGQRAVRRARRCRGAAGQESPGPVLRSQQSLRLPWRASSGPPAPPLLPLTSAPQLAFGSRLPLCSRPSSRSLSQEDEDDEDEELRVRPECL